MNVRNFAGECAYNYPPSPSEPISCNLVGLMDVLLQVQSFYQTTEIDELLTRNAQVFAIRNYSSAIAAPCLPYSIVTPFQQHPVPFPGPIEEK